MQSQQMSYKQSLKGYSKVNDTAENIEAPTVEQEVFDDRWCCAMCRDAERICDFHQSMEDDGYKPPLNFSNLL